jgi:hypothetical protein
MAIQQHHIKTISIKHSGGFMEYYGCIPHKHHRSIGHQNTMDNGMIRAQALWESFSNPSSGTAFQFAGLLILFSIRRLCGLKLSRRHVFRNLLRGFARKIVHKWCYTWIFDCVYNFYYLSAFAAAFTARLWHTPFAELSRVEVLLSRRVPHIMNPNANSFHGGFWCYSNEKRAKKTNKSSLLYGSLHSNTIDT